MRGSQAVALRSVAHFLPERRVTSREIEQQVRDASGGMRLASNLIERLSGVRERRFADDDVHSSDLAAAAGAKALERACLNPLDVDVVIFAAASHDMTEPATSNVVQASLGCANASVFDVKNACNSFLNGVDVASALITTGRATTVLVTSGEKLSPSLNFDLREPEALKWGFAALTLGDAGAAAVLGPADEHSSLVGRGWFRSFGEEWDRSVILAGGTRAWRDVNKTYFECDSARLHQLAVMHIPKVILSVLDEVGWGPEDVTRVIPHQVSRAVVRDIAVQVAIPLERCVITLPEVGNTAAASIPLAMSLRENAGEFADGDRILLVGGAAGFSVGVMPLLWRTRVGTP